MLVLLWGWKIQLPEPLGACSLKTAGPVFKGRREALSSKWILAVGAVGRVSGGHRRAHS